MSDVWRQTSRRPATKEGTMHKKIAQSGNNPSAADMIDAFARAYDKTPKELAFHMEDGKTISVQITGLGYESGTPGMLLFSGHSGGKRIEGYYNANNRAGWVK